jgi:hypothetical protein
MYAGPIDEIASKISRQLHNDRAPPDRLALVSV